MQHAPRQREAARRSDDTIPVQTKNGAQTMVISSFWDTLLGKTGKRPTMGAMLLQSAHVRAWSQSHDVVRLEHLVSALVDLTDVERALEARGMQPADVQAVLDQLIEGLPRRAEDAADIEPTFDKALDALVVSARLNGVLSSAPFIENIANALPPELGFVRRPLAASATELGATFDAPIAFAANGGLTFEGWDDDLQKCMGLMQVLSDTRWEAWHLGTIQLFVALLSYKPYHAKFKARGVDPNAVIREIGEHLPNTRLPSRDRPAGFKPSVGPGLFAVILRAERYAAADASDVRLRHLLQALHEEPHLKASIDMLVA